MQTHQHCSLEFESLFCSQIMVLFYNISQTIRSSWIDDDRLDIISKLPVEILTSIFQLLDPSSMHSAMQVCQTWYQRYRSDPRLKRTLKRKVRQQRKQRLLFIHNFSVRPTDHWYRNEIPKKVVHKVKKLVRKLKKTNKFRTMHKSCAKPLRLQVTQNSLVYHSEKYPYKMTSESSKRIHSTEPQDINAQFSCIVNNLQNHSEQGWCRCEAISKDIALYCETDNLYSITTVIL